MLHEAMAGFVDRGEIPGIVTLVAKGAHADVDALGTMTTGGSEPMKRDTIFRIASITKPITAAAAMILVDDGKLKLDDAIDRWLPEMANRKVLKSIQLQLDDTVPARRAITVRDVLTFTFGFGSVMAMPGTYPIQKPVADGHLGGDGLPHPSQFPAMDEWIRRLGALWGFGMSVDIHQENPWNVPGRFGWDGGYGTSAYSDPKNDFVGILLTQRCMDSPEPPQVLNDFWREAYRSR